MKRGDTMGIFEGNAFNDKPHIYDDTPQGCYERIKALYEKAGGGSSEKSIADSLGVNPSTVSRWKERFPSVANLKEITEKFNVSFEYLVYGKISANIPDSPRDICMAILYLRQYFDVKISTVPAYRRWGTGATPCDIDIKLTPLESIDIDLVKKVARYNLVRKCSCDIQDALCKMEKIFSLCKDEYEFYRLAPKLCGLNDSDFGKNELIEKDTPIKCLPLNEFWDIYEQLKKDNIPFTAIEVSKRLEQMKKSQA